MPTERSCACRVRSLLDSPLQQNETPQEFDLVAPGGGPVVVQRIKFTTTAGISDDHWDLGEVEGWGQLLEI